MSNPLIYLFAKTWEYSVGNRRSIVLFWCMFIIGQSITLFGQPLAWAKIMDTVQTQGITTQSIKTLFALLMLILAIDIAFWAFHGPARLMERANAFKARLNYRKNLLQGIMTLPLGWHTEHHSGKTIDMIEKGTAGLHEFSGHSHQMIYGMVQLVGSYCMLAYFSPPAGGIVLVMVMLTMWITMRFDRILIRQYREITHAENDISESVFDAISNIGTVIILRVEQLVFKAIMHKVELPFDLVKRNNRLTEWKWFLTNMCCSTMTITVLVTYFWQHLGAEGGILVGSVYILVQYLGRMSELFFKFTELYGEVVQQRARVANAEELSADFQPEQFTNHVLPRDWKLLRIEDLTFQYDQTAAERQLNGVALSIARGERIAFVGETGSGKTTMLKIMRQLYTPQSLILSVDGEIVPDGFGGISRAIALVPQDPEIFATTIWGNITLGAEHDLATVRRFADMACFTSVVDSLPNGYNSSINERGVNLSGGQQQRLALSRGLLACADKDIVLFDESTSSLDGRTEMKVYQNIFRGFPGKTIVSSIHRLHLLTLFDRICMFKNGRIIGSGTLAELLDSCPEFVSLWEAMQQITADDGSATV